MTISAARYHRETSYLRDRMGGHSMDWANQPNVYKTYPGIEPIPLSREPRQPVIPLLELFGKNPAAVPRQELTTDDLSIILLLTHSLTARARHPGGDFYYRSTASAGALYPTEIYAALTGVYGLEDGLYHFSIARHGLSLLRSGKFQTAPPTDRPQKPAGRPLITIFLTAIFFRSSWKYRDRAWRYHLLDTGHVIEHLVLALKALALPYQLTADFDDRSVGRLLGLDEKLEVPLAVCQRQYLRRVPGLRRRCFSGSFASPLSTGQPGSGPGGGLSTAVGGLRSRTGDQKQTARIRQYGPPDRTGTEGLVSPSRFLLAGRNDESGPGRLYPPLPA